MAFTYQKMLMAEYQYLATLEGQAQFIAEHAGLSEDCVKRVLVQRTTQRIAGEEWDLEAQARDAGMSFEEYAIAMSPLMQMSLEQSQARLHEMEAVLSRHEDLELSDDEVEIVNKWKSIVGAIASLSGEEIEDVIRIVLFADTPNRRQHEILQEIIRLKALGEGPSESTL